MNTRIITIGRQFGSNGHLIAHELAKQLGIKCYDKSLISFAAEHTGIPYSRLEIVDEKKENKWRYLVDGEEKKQCKHIYLYAPEDFRIHTIMNRYGMSKKDAANLMKKVDKDRRYYYNYHTDQK